MVNSKRYLRHLSGRLRMSVNNIERNRFRKYRSILRRGVGHTATWILSYAGTSLIVPDEMCRKCRICHLLESTENR